MKYKMCLVDVSILLSYRYVQYLCSSVTTRWLEHDQTLPLSVKGVACKTMLDPIVSLTVLFLRWFQCSLAYIAPRFNTFLLPCCCQGVASGEPPTRWSANGGVPVRWYSKAKIPTERTAKRLEK